MNVKKKIRKVVREVYLTVKHFFYAPSCSIFHSKRNTCTLIFCVNGWVYHGGWVDRLKGAVSMYAVAKDLGMDFKIVYDSPFYLHEYLTPHLVNWQPDAETLLFSPFLDKVVYLMEAFDCKNLSIFKRSKVRKFFVYCNVDYLPSLGLSSSWGTCFRELFAISNKLQFQLNKYIKTGTQRSVAFHARFRNLLGDFEVESGPPLPKHRRMLLLKSIVEIIEEFHSKNNGYMIFVFSDSANFVSYVLELCPFVITTENDPIHVDSRILRNSSQVEYHLFEKVLLDFFIISTCDQVFLLKGEGMYNSAFSKYASFLGHGRFAKIPLRDF